MFFVSWTRTDFAAARFVVRGRNCVNLEEDESVVRGDSDTGELAMHLAS
jgi:hypothetical protein